MSVSLILILSGCYSFLTGLFTPYFLYLLTISPVITSLKVFCLYFSSYYFVFLNCGTTILFLNTKHTANTAHVMLNTPIAHVIAKSSITPGTTASHIGFLKFSNELINTEQLSYCAKFLLLPTNASYFGM